MILPMEKKVRIEKANSQPMGALFHFTWIAVTASMLCVASVAQAGLCKDTAESNTVFGTFIKPGITLKKTRLSDRLDPNDPSDKARYFRINISVEPRGAKDWYLSVRDHAHRLRASFGPDDIEAGNKSFWSSRIYACDHGFSCRDEQGNNQSHRFYVELDLKTPQSMTQVKIKEAFYMPEKVGEDRAYYSWQDGAAKYVSLYKYESGVAPQTKRVKRLGDSVGFLYAIGPKPGVSEPANWCCSGAMVTPDLFLTNWHCGASDKLLGDNAYWRDDGTCKTSIIDLSWDEDRMSRDMACSKVVARSKPHDYALLRVRPAFGMGGSQSQPRPVRITADVPTKDQELIIVHHPECKRKQISHNCRLKKADHPGWVSGAPNDFAHKCDTEGGSSGAPVFDTSGRLVGLHHLGFSVIDEVSCKKDKLNKAVYIREILMDLKQRNNAAYQEIINSSPDARISTP